MNKQQHGVVVQAGSILHGHDIDMSYMIKRMRGNHKSLKANYIWCAREVDATNDHVDVYHKTLNAPL